MKYLIVANGFFLPHSIIHELAQQRQIVALDGAADRLALLGILPHIILGDFDTIQKNNVWGIQNRFDEINQNTTSYSGKYGVTIVPAKDQDYTDLIKAIKYCDQHSATQIDIVCAVGVDRLDHTLNNCRVLRSHYQPNRPIFLHGEMQSLSFCKNETVIISGEPEEYCGILAFPEAAFSSQGLKYNGDHFPLQFAYSESICNQLVGQSATIQVQGEALIAHPPITKAQRIFSQKSHVERMEILLREQNRELIEIPFSELGKTKSGKKLSHSDFIYVVSSNKDKILDTDLPSNELILISKHSA